MDMKDEKRRTRARAKAKMVTTRRRVHKNCDESTLTTMKREKGRVARMRSI